MLRIFMLWQPKQDDDLKSPFIFLNGSTCINYVEYFTTTYQLKSSITLIDPLITNWMLWWYRPCIYFYSAVFIKAVISTVLIHKIRRKTDMLRIINQLYLLIYNNYPALDIFVKLFYGCLKYIRFGILLHTCKLQNDTT